MMDVDELEPRRVCQLSNKHNPIQTFQNDMFQTRATAENTRKSGNIFKTDTLVKVNATVGGFLSDKSRMCS